MDLWNKDLAIKISWKKLLTEEPDTTHLDCHSVCWDLKEHIWKYNLSTDDMKYLNIVDEFWKVFLTAWCQYNNSAFDPNHNVLVWWNPNMCISNKPFFWQEPFFKGLVHTKDLMDGNRFVSAKVAHEKYGLSIMEYDGIV